MEPRYQSRFVQSQVPMEGRFREMRDLHHTQRPDIVVQGRVGPQTLEKASLALCKNAEITICLSPCSRKTKVSEMRALPGDI